MPVISSFGALQSYSSPGAAPGAAPVADYPTTSWIDQACNDTYAAIYRTQPNVRTVVDALARNFAQVPLHAYRRISDLDRERLVDHELIRWITRPNPSTTAFRLFETLMQDMGVFMNAYWLKVRSGATRGLVRLPPQEITVQGWLLPRAFTWTLPDGRTIDLAPEQVAHFRGHDPWNPLSGLSPIETLRQLLAEDAAQTAYRSAYWQNSARLEGVIERPAGAPKWTTDQKQAFREQWQARYAGRAGQTAVLEDGMTFKGMSHSARDAEFVEARKLTREEVTSAYHYPLPLVGILDHATFSNIKEQHKHLYQDTLGPWFEQIQQEIERQLLVECSDTRDVYLEFNIADKLKGSFEEQSASLFRLVGRPIMTANEGRARLNLPSITDDPSADQLALPMNTATGAALDESDESDAPDVDVDTVEAEAIERAAIVPPLLLAKENADAA